MIMEFKVSVDTEKEEDRELLEKIIEIVEQYKEEIDRNKLTKPK